MKRYYMAAVLILLTFSSLFGESSITTKMELYDFLTRGGEKIWYSRGLGMLRVTSSQKNSNVKSQLTILASPDETGKYSFSISRAFAKFRFPWFRMVIGKAPLSWGEGLIFNAGDLLFSDSVLNKELMQSEFMGSAFWLSGITYPLGPFSYAEAIFLPPETITGTLDKPKTGGRFVTKIKNTKLEAGYLYDGSENIHKPYVSLQGNFGINWHLSGTAFFDKNKSAADSLEKSFTVTAGIYSLQSIGYNGTLGFRVETLVRPFEKWEEYTEPGGNTGSYGLYVYPEVTYSFNRGMTVMLRSYTSPIDMSAIVVPGFSWNVFQGTTLLLMASLGIGESGDTYVWLPDLNSKPTSKGAPSLIAGFSVAY